MPLPKNIDPFKVANYRWLNLEEAAEYCRCSVQHFYDHYKDRLPFSRPDYSKKAVYDSRDLDHILESDKQHPTKKYPQLNEL